MDTFSAMLGPSFKSFDGCDFDNKPIDLPFQSRKVIEFSFPFPALVLLLHSCICILLVSRYIWISVLVMIFLLEVFAKAFCLASVFLKSCSP